MLKINENSEFIMILYLLYFYVVCREERNKSDLPNKVNISTTTKLSISIAVLCAERKLK